MKILIVEDEASLASDIRTSLISVGHTCFQADNKFAAIDQMLISSFDLLVLDINLPDGSGLEIIEWLKENKRKEHVIIVSAKDGTHDKILGLDLGADDYVTKPFHMGELNSRINAISRRKDTDGNNVIEFNEIVIIPRLMEVRINDKRLELTRTEYSLLRYFMLNRRTVLSKRSITSHVWENEFIGDGAYNFIYVHIKNLRRKILEAGGNDYLKTVYGVGYKFEDE